LSIRAGLTATIAATFAVAASIAPLIGDGFALFGRQHTVGLLARVLANRINLAAPLFVGQRGVVAYGFDLVARLLANGVQLSFLLIRQVRNLRALSLTFRAIARWFVGFCAGWFRARFRLALRRATALRHGGDGHEDAKCDVRCESNVFFHPGYYLSFSMAQQNAGVNT
jgi:hypothetical protein